MILSYFFSRTRVGIATVSFVDAGAGVNKMFISYNKANIMAKKTMKKGGGNEKSAFFHSSKKHFFLTKKEDTNTNTSWNGDIAGIFTEEFAKLVDAGPDIPVFLHPFTEENKPLFEKLHLNSDLITPHGLFHDYKKDDTPLWVGTRAEEEDFLYNRPQFGVYSNSVKFVYANWNTGEVTSKDYIPRGYPIRYFDFLLFIFLTYILIKGDKKTNDVFFSHVSKSIVPLFEVGYNTHPWAGISDIYGLIELLSSYFSFSANPNNFYIWPEKKKYIQIIFRCSLYS